MSYRYYLKKVSDWHWREVSVDEYVEAEKAAGFIGGRPGKPCTNSFRGTSGLEGKSVYEWNGVQRR